MLGVQFGTGRGIITLELLWGPRRLEHKSLQELDLCSFYVWNINRFLIYWHKIKWTSATSRRKIDRARRTGKKYTGGVLHCAGKVVWGSGWVKHRLHSLEDLLAVVKSCLEEWRDQEVQVSVRLKHSRGFQSTLKPARTDCIHSVLQNLIQINSKSPIFYAFFPFFIVVTDWEVKTTSWVTQFGF